MQHKFRTQAICWGNIQPGMLIGCPGGCAKVTKVEKTADGRYKLSFENGMQVIQHGSNWPDRYIEITD